MASGKREIGELTLALAAELRAEIARARLTQLEVAAMAGVSAQTLSKLLRGKAVLDVEQLAALSATLGMPASDVMTQAEHALHGTQANVTPLHTREYPATFTELEEATDEELDLPAVAHDPHDSIESLQAEQEGYEEQP